MRNSLPKLLLIDMTAMTGPAATSSLKRAFFGDWRANGLLHVRSGGKELVLMTALDGNEILLAPDIASTKKVIDTFKPDIILYRPVADHPKLHECAMNLIACSDAPLMLWMMDDWPERLRIEAPDAAAAIDTDLKVLFERSALNLSISEGMSRVFSERYGVPFTVAHNGIIPVQWPEGKPRTELQSFVGDGLASSDQAPLRMRYAGSLAPDTTRDSVFAVAKVVSKLAAQGHNVCFEGHTQTHWHTRYAGDFNALPGVSMNTSDLSDGAYRKWLSEADILLLAYNFDEATQRYLQYSFANKMPELLASGVPVLAYGPLQLETLSYLHRNKLSKTVSDPDVPQLEAAIEQLIDQPDLRRQLGRIGREHAVRVFNFENIKTGLIEQMQSLVPPSARLFGQIFERSAVARLDEGQLIADLLRAPERPGVMIDVGAHLGSSLMPFVRSDWSVLAFEPDQVNREGLLEKVAAYPKVQVYDSAVGREIQAEAAFYRSAISSGISSLTAFHESHEAGPSVAVTTLDAVINSAGLTEVDFLKVDVEGHEMDVLDGFDLGALRPRAIMLEFEDGKVVGSSNLLKALAERLLAHDYHVYISEWHQVVEYGCDHDWRQLAAYPASLAEGSWGNIIAFREEVSIEEINTAMVHNTVNNSVGVSALGALSRLAPRPSLRRRILTWIARKMPWLRSLWRAFKGVAQH
ncbi:MAG: FkbM family methyltransferase [Hyphomonadaceae bacterium]